jgi:hypothetical protein
MPPGQVQLSQAADQVKALLEGAYADWYSSIALRQPDGPGPSARSALVVYRIPHPALDEAVRKLVPGLPVLFVDAKYSDKQTRQFENQISFGYWKDLGLQINMLGCDDGVCTIGVDDPDKWRAALQAEYGADRIIVIKQGAVAG